tara:strand:+ start:1512 stop:1790 length:279 start_codon:yes stop_codon:yes gene_type:complete
MEVTNEEQNVPRLTQADLAIAAFALAETFNAYLARYEEEDFGDMTKEQYESSLNSLRMAFGKFDAICHAMNPPPTEEEQNISADDDTQTMEE